MFYPTKSTGHRVQDAMGDVPKAAVPSLLFDPEAFDDEPDELEEPFELEFDSDIYDDDFSVIFRGQRAADDQQRPD
ncbi:MAG TPA: hypothetical protein ENK85_07600 [Saprospiraceae bacterium]|nr:hypothetical protein [Saprospiraceae bacterium]